ncbi:ATP-binding protein [Actinocrispum wychmicini]|uniref:ATP-binding protein n=1 Tax=Actinocrispum wychmicini TaxID=1213861 RepID=UPI0014044361|nr:AAA family ATPase [Actinocrispum wychmicini]
MPVSDAGPQSFGTVLTRLRRAAGLTQEELAERAGLSARGIGNLERGVRRPRRFTVQLLVDGLALAEPDRDELVAASRRAHQDSDAGEPSVVPGPHLVGRGEERALIEAHLGASDSPMLLLTGQTGIGKTRLLAEAARLAQARRMTVLSGACQRFGGEPYAPVVDALAGYVRGASPLALRRHLNDCAGLERLLPEVGGELAPGPSRTRRLMFGAAARFVGSLAARHGVLLVLDDLQWAGADGLTLLASLVRAVRPDRVRILAAYRDTEVPPSGPVAETVLDLARLHLVTHRPLSPLAEPDAATLLRRSAGVDVRDDVRERVLRLAGGLPLFLVQLGHALGGGDTVLSVPWGLTHAVRQQLGALPTATVEVLTLLAVGQRRLDVDALATAAGLDPDDLPDVLAPAHAARLLDETSAGVRLTHELVAEVINADLNPGHRHLLHRRLADALRPAGAAAYHYTHAQDPERAAQTLRRAAEQAARQAAHDTAARYLGDLVDLLDRAGPQSAVAEAAEEWAGELAAAGRYDAALAAAERALLVYRKEGDDERQRLVIARIGYLHYQRGTPREGLARIATADQPESGAAVQLHLARAANLYQSTRYQDAVETCTAAIAAATAAGDERGIAGGHLRRGLAARLLGDNRVALADLHAAASTAELCGDRNTVLRALTGIAVLHHYRGELSRADRQFTRILQLAEELGDREVLSRAVCNVGASAVYLGHWRLALRRFEQALDLAGADSSPMCASMALIGRGSLLSACGRHDEARADLLTVVRLGVDSDNIDLVRNASAQLAETDVRLGRPDEGAARLLPLLDRPGLHEWQVTDSLPFLAQAQLAAGDPDAATRTAAEAAGRAQDIEHAIARTDALRVHGMAAAELGETSVATASVREALSLANATGSPYLEARVRSAWATVARRCGDPDRAAHEQELADGLFVALRQEVMA